VNNEQEGNIEDGIRRKQQEKQMPRQRSESQLETLRAQASALDQKIKEVAARERAKRDEADHRRQILVGQAVLYQMEVDSAFAAAMMPLIDRRARAATDRALFDLPPVSKDQPENSSALAMDWNSNNA
jgi:hypothetical protein